MFRSGSSLFFAYRFLLVLALTLSLAVLVLAIVLRPAWIFILLISLFYSLAAALSAIILLAAWRGERARHTALGSRGALELVPVDEPDQAGEEAGEGEQEAQQLSGPRTIWSSRGCIQIRSKTTPNHAHHGPQARVRLIERWQPLLLSSLSLALISICGPTRLAANGSSHTSGESKPDSTQNSEPQWDIAQLDPGPSPYTSSAELGITRALLACMWTGSACVPCAALLAALSRSSLSLRNARTFRGSYTVRPTRKRTRTRTDE